MNLREFFKELTRSPSHIELAARELAEAQKSRLSALSAAEYATSMAEYHLNRIRRLQELLKESSE